MELPLFPLNAHLLPGGIMPMRIFEPRYQRLVSLASARGFVLCMLDPQAQQAVRNMLPIGTRVEIVDFDLLGDGLLGITVRGVERVRVGEVRQEADGLRWGEVAALPPWPSVSVSPAFTPLVEKLIEVFDDYPEYGALYREPHWEDGCWVAQRWLEMLPLSPHQKQWLLGEESSAPVQALLERLVQPG
ncbi:ATP-dependent protease La [Aeromonas diversa CDC 2478-85]|uniref:ATP-dependent protease La n=1 Tax=Aeromonas diversa CDC 2478-85 TaxID=1268237 RepID=N9V539_9GAMM|nr:LON peptidase substrate-binding domain-containing protein [Aeromonas diversa]ENY70457.1 ATP-dependent protease La [Aeromonas diversa CDC 2478-85]